MVLFRMARAPLSPLWLQECGICDDAPLPLPAGQRHIRVGKQIVNIPSFMVRTDSQKHIDFAVTSPYGGGRPGRNKRKSIASKGGGGGGGDDEEME